MIGIVVSTEMEAGHLLQNLAGVDRISFQNKIFYRGKIRDTIAAAICICGVGKTNAAHGTTLLLEKFRPEIVYSIGVAGAYPSSGLRIGEIAVAEKEVYGDEGLALQDDFHAMDALNLPLCTIDKTDYYNEFPLTVPDGLGQCSLRGTFVTVSSCSGTRRRGEELKRRFNALCENMEGAAVAHICLLNNVPAAEIRGISNIVEDRNGKPLRRDDIINAAEKAQRLFIERLR